MGDDSVPELRIQKSLVQCIGVHLDKDLTRSGRYIRRADTLTGPKSTDPSERAGLHRPAILKSQRTSRAARREIVLATVRQDRDPRQDETPRVTAMEEVSWEIRR
jgi:hypothetical protein